MEHLLGADIILSSGCTLSYLILIINDSCKVGLIFADGET